MDVDDGIADLLKALWERGIQTRYSCEGYPSKKRRFWRNAYIMFDSPDDAARFGVALDPSHAICDFVDGRITQTTTKSGNIKFIEHPENWVWQMNVCPHPFSEWTKENPKFERLEITACVRFPPEHITSILAALRPVQKLP